MKSVKFKFEISKPFVKNGCTNYLIEYINIDNFEIPDNTDTHYLQDLFQDFLTQTEFNKYLRWDKLKNLLDTLW